MRTSVLLLSALAGLAVAFPKVEVQHGGRSGATGSDPSAGTKLRRGMNLVRLAQDPQKPGHATASGLPPDSTGAGAPYVSNTGPDGLQKRGHATATAVAIASGFLPTADPTGGFYIYRAGPDGMQKRGHPTTSGCYPENTDAGAGSDDPALEGYRRKEAPRACSS